MEELPIEDVILFQDQISTTSSQSSSLRKAFTNEWALRIAGGSEEEAARLAAKYGYQNLGRVSVCFLWRCPGAELPKLHKWIGGRAFRANSIHTSNLISALPGGPISSDFIQGCKSLPFTAYKSCYVLRLDSWGK